MRVSLIAISLALIALNANVASAQDSHVQVQLLSSVSAVTPGKPFYLGIKLTMDSGWHIYWKNAGDAGLPTRVTFSLPDGFTAGGIIYPTPQRLEQPGNIINFGYEDTVMLMALITPPQNLPENFSGQFVANVSWLVCADNCIPGKGSDAVTLGESDTPQPNKTEVFDEWLKQVPVPVDQSHAVQGDKADVSFVNGQLTIKFAWDEPGPPTNSIAVIAGSLDDYNITKTDVQSSGPQTTIVCTLQPLAGKKSAAATFDVVVRYTNSADGRPRGLIIPVSLPAFASDQH